MTASEGRDPAEPPATQDGPELTPPHGMVPGRIGLTTVILAALVWSSRQL